MFVSGSQDKTARLWDLRAPAAVNVIPSPSPGSHLEFCTFLYTELSSVNIV